VHFYLLLFRSASLPLPRDVIPIVLEQDLNVIILPDNVTRTQYYIRVFNFENHTRVYGEATIDVSGCYFL